MITGDQLLVHAIGDYCLQSDWMAQTKTKSWWPALVHVTLYTTCFLALTRSVAALAVIWSTHLLIDHYRLARFVCYAKNYLAPRSYWYKWIDCNATGYSKAMPPWLTTWLMILVDQVMHITINGMAIRWL